MIFISTAFFNFFQIEKFAINTDVELDKQIGKKFMKGQKKIDHRNDTATE